MYSDDYSLWISKEKVDFWGILLVLQKKLFEEYSLPKNSVLQVQLSHQFLLECQVSSSIVKRFPLGLQKNIWLQMNSKNW